jgi:outer membrane murein-binding lipoprotein Lpp
MYRYFIVGALILATFAVSGCATTAPRQLASDFGLAPQHYEPQVIAYFRGQLKDPDSAKYKFGDPYRAFTYKHVFYGPVSWSGYALDVEVNAKNGFGGYTGFTEYTVLLDGNTVKSALEGPRNDYIIRTLEPVRGTENRPYPEPTQHTASDTESMNTELRRLAIDSQAHGDQKAAKEYLDMIVPASSQH